MRGDSSVRLSGKKLVEYRKQLLGEMAEAVGAMQDHADRLGDPKYPAAEADLKAAALRYQAAGLKYMRNIAKHPDTSPIPATPPKEKRRDAASTEPEVNP